MLLMTIEVLVSTSVGPRRTCIKMLCQHIVCTEHYFSIFCSLCLARILCFPLHFVSLCFSVVVWLSRLSSV